MDRDALLRQLDHERRHLARDDESIDLLPTVARLTVGGTQHAIAWSRLDADNIDDAIRREIEHHRAAGVEFEWKVYAHDTPHDLCSRLSAHGFTIGPEEAVMAASIDALLAQATAISGVEVERIASAAQLDTLRRVAEEAFGRDYGFTTGQLARSIDRGSTEHLAYLARVEGEVAAIGRLYTHPRSRFAGLYGGATLPRFRGRGCYRALVVERARAGRSLGATHALVDALPTSRPILERLGFDRLTDTWPCMWSPE